MQALSPASRRIPAALVAAVACTAVTACGGGGTVTGVGTAATGKSSPYALSKCMRAHGISNFPDPTVSPGGGAGLTISRSIGSAALTVDGISFSGPAFEAASKACKEYLPGGGGPPPPMTAAQKRRLLAMAQCMRTHGVPTFPDPTFSGGGARLRPLGVDPRSPAFQHAAAACGGPRISVVKG